MRVKVHRETKDVLEVHFTVEDTGIGIEEEVRQKLFRPFSQADRYVFKAHGGPYTTFALLDLYESLG